MVDKKKIKLEENNHSDSADELMNWMDCLADLTRLRLLRLLEIHELGVVELCDVLQLPQSTVSRHLKLLGTRGWVKSRRKGTANLYRMDIKSVGSGGHRLWKISSEQIANWPRLNEDQGRLETLLSNKQKQSEAFFAGAANEWLKMRDELYGQRFSFDGIAALLPNDWVIADLGCGTGQVTSELSGCVKRVIGVDRSSAMLAAANKRLAGYSNVDLRQGTLEKLPIEDSICDAAVMMVVLSYLADPVAVLTEAKRIIKQGGSLVLIDLQKHSRDDFRKEMGQEWLGFSSDEIENYLKQAGFSDVSYRDLPLTPQAKGPGLFLVKGIA